MGKGDKDRTADREKYRDNFDSIFNKDKQDEREKELDAQQEAEVQQSEQEPR